MSQARQQRRAAARLEQKRKTSSALAQVRAKRHLEWKEAWNSRFETKRTPWQSFLFLLTTLFHILAFQYYQCVRIAEYEPTRVNKKKAR
jgi:hypothetical protein